MTDPDSPIAHLNQIIDDAENKLKQSLQAISKWNEEAVEFVNQRPGTVMAAIALASFFAGASLRQGTLLKALRSTVFMSGDPLVLLMTSAIMGFAAGPKAFHEAKHAPRRQSPARV